MREAASPRLPKTSSSVVFPVGEQYTVDVAEFLDNIKLECLHYINLPFEITNRSSAIIATMVVPWKFIFCCGEAYSDNYQT